MLRVINLTNLNSNRIFGTVGNTGHSTGPHLHHTLYTLQGNYHSEAALRFILNNNIDNTVISNEERSYPGTFYSQTKKVTYDIQNFMNFPQRLNGVLIK